MQIPLELTCQGIENAEEIEELVRRKVEKLEQVCDYLVSCRVAIDSPQAHQQSGNPFRVRIELRVPPGHDLTVIRQTTGQDRHDPVAVVVREAFAAARRQLRNLVRKQRGEVKQHLDPLQVALVAKIFPERGYGFLRTEDLREVYFHRNSVLNDDFERLEIGTGVRYVEEDGDEGPMASTVQIVDVPALGTPRGEDPRRVPLEPPEPLF